MSTLQPMFTTKPQHVTICIMLFEKCEYLRRCNYTQRYIFKLDMHVEASHSQLSAEPDSVE